MTQNSETQKDTKNSDPKNATQDQKKMNSTDMSTESDSENDGKTKAPDREIPKSNKMAPGQNTHAN